MVRSIMNSAWQCLCNLFEKSWKEFRAESRRWIVNPLLNRRTLPFQFNFSTSLILTLYIYVQGHYLLLLFSETLKLKLVFVPVKKNNRVSSSNVFHLDFTPEKKTTEIIWLFSVVCFPISVFVVEVFHRNTESKSKRTKWCDPRLVALSSTGTICLSPDHDISQYELWKSSTILENADIFHQMTWITTMIL